MKKVVVLKQQKVISLNSFLSFLSGNKTINIDWDNRDTVYGSPRLLFTALFIVVLIGVICTSCLIRPKTPPEEALGNLVTAHIDNPQRLLEINSPLAYSLFEPLMQLDGERAAVLILAPMTKVSSYATMSNETGVIQERLSSASAPDIQSPAMALSEKLESTANGIRLNLARGNRIAVMFVTSSMAESLKKSRRVYVSGDYFISEEGFLKRFGKKPHEQYSIEYTQTGEWRVSPASGSGEVFLADDEVDSYIRKNGPPWEYTKLGNGRSQDESDMQFYQVKVYGINHKIMTPGDVIIENRKEVVGIFTRPAIKGISFLDGESAIELLSGILPQMPNMTDGEEALQQLVPGFRE